MGSAFALAVVLMQAASSGGFGGARPAECGESGVKVANPWERAKEPQLRRYCDLIARGTSRLVGTGSGAGDVLGIADEADKLLPGRAAPSVLRGRAYLKLDKPQEALAALVEAKKRDDRALDDPVALLAWARANARTRHVDEAAQAYRAALPRTSALSTQERAGASFEAGLVVMEQGAKGIDDAAAMFRQARRDAQDAMQVAATVALALSLDRAGEKDEAKAVLAERARTDVKALLTDPRVTEALVNAGVRHEQDALLALALEGVDAAASHESWRKYLAGAGGKGPWAEHARSHEGGGGKPPAKPKPAGR